LKVYEANLRVFEVYEDISKRVKFGGIFEVSPMF
jgi:hypothetical protein